MDCKEIYELIKLIDSSQLAYFELKDKDFYVKMDKSYHRENVEKLEKEHRVYGTEDNSKPCEVKTEEALDLNQKDSDSAQGNLECIVSPMVGTFYITPGPDKEPFVSIGDKVKKGKIICIIEAMKLMNEIECEVDGEIVEILVQNGNMVEYGEPLFKIRK